MRDAIVFVDRQAGPAALEPLHQRAVCTRRLPKVWSPKAACVPLSDLQLLDVNAPVNTLQAAIKLSV
jgi:hypothetical protein